MSIRPVSVSLEWSGSVDRWIATINASQSAWYRALSCPTLACPITGPSPVRRWPARNRTTDNQPENDTTDPVGFTPNQPAAKPQHPTEDSNTGVKVLATADRDDRTETKGSGHPETTDNQPGKQHSRSNQPTAGHATPHHESWQNNAGCSHQPRYQLHTRSAPQPDTPVGPCSQQLRARNLQISSSEVEVVVSPAGLATPRHESWQNDAGCGHRPRSPSYRRPAGWPG